MTWFQALVVVSLSVATCVAYRIVGEARRRDRRERAELAEALREMAHHPGSFTLNDIRQLRRVADLLEVPLPSRLVDLYLDGDR